jgi:acyl-CoA synthetase (AMP-forming)/AMP-acid ligase II
MLIHQYLENSAARFPDKDAVIYDGVRATYQQMNTQATNLARHLRANGILKGDRIALLLENSIDYVIAYYGILKAGCVAAPLNPGLKPDGLQYLLGDLKPAAIISNFKSERLLGAVELNSDEFKLMIIRSPKQKWSNRAFKISGFEEAVSSKQDATGVDPVHENDLASIIYTSGSTGIPKGVMLSHGNIVANTDSICRYLNLTESDIQMVVLPFFYVMGKSLLNTHMAAGGTIVINNRFLYPADVVHQIIDEKVTGFSGVPSTYAYLLNRSPLAACRDKLAHLRYCSQAGGHMAASLKKELRRTLPAHTEIIIMYGATEASARLTYLDPTFFDSKMGSIGKPIPGVKISILDEMGKEVPDGMEGELVATGANIMRGYWKDPTDTARVVDQHGYHTGDIGYRDSDGFLYVKRRKDGLLKVGGHRINPVEIEDFLLSTELLIEAAVLGIPDPLMGTRLIALVVPKDEKCTTKTLLEICAGALPNHKFPSEIMMVKALPKMASGKIDREKSAGLAATSSKRA